MLGETAQATRFHERTAFCLHDPGSKLHKTYVYTVDCRQSTVSKSYHYSNLLSSPISAGAHSGASHSRSWMATWGLCRDPAAYAVCGRLADLGTALDKRHDSVQPAKKRRAGALFASRQGQRSALALTKRPCLDRAGIATAGQRPGTTRRGMIEAFPQLPGVPAC